MDTYRIHDVTNFDDFELHNCDHIEIRGGALHLVTEGAPSRVIIAGHWGLIVHEGAVENR